MNEWATLERISWYAVIVIAVIFVVAFLVSWILDEKRQEDRRQNEKKRTAFHEGANVTNIREIRAELSDGLQVSAVTSRSSPPGMPVAALPSAGSMPYAAGAEEVAGVHQDSAAYVRSILGD